MAKPRVHELAKELGIPSKEAVAKLQELGEYVRGASSTVEPPVEKKLRAAFADRVKKQEPAKDSAAKGSAPKPSGAGNRPAATHKTAGKTAPSPAQMGKPAGQQAPAQPAPQAKTEQGASESAPSAPARPAAKPSNAPKPGQKPGPKPGNNPFSTQQGMKGSEAPTPGPRPSASRGSAPKPGAPRPGNSGSRGRSG
ncbi:translation initiation factor 2 [Mycobacteroides abscessus subsp. abscessus]|nr:translation initiation factor 2 [Mycobacteroides abscessus subsp. abscessus]